MSATTTSTPEEGWSHGSADLNERCAQLAREASELLDGAVSEEATRLARQGFHVVSEESLAHAVRVLSRMAEAPGGKYTDMPQWSAIDLIIGFASVVEGIESEWDMAPLSTWWTWRESKSVSEALRQAQGMRSMINAGKRDRVFALLALDIKRAQNEWGNSR